MKYQKWYDGIIQNAQARAWNKKTKGVYVERHHIVPLSIGGSNLSDNISFLTPKEHFICHLLLIQIYDDPIIKRKMTYSLYKMCGYNKNTRQREKMSSRWFMRVRKMMSENCSGSNHPQYGKTHPSKGKSRPKDVREKISNSLTGKKYGPQSENVRMKKTLSQRTHDIYIDEIRYLSLNDASRKTGTNKGTLRYRISSNNWPNYYRQTV